MITKEQIDKLDGLVGAISTASNEVIGRAMTTGAAAMSAITRYNDAEHALIIFVIELSREFDE